LVRPYNKDEIQKGKKLAELYGTRFIEEVAPIQIIGTGQTINEATENGLKRTAALLGESLEKTRNRATITGCVEIGRLPGVVTISVLAPFERLEELKIADLVSQMYKLEFL
jgi:formamidase